MSEVVNEIIPIEMIADHPENYRQHPDEQIRNLEASIARFGQVRSAVVQRGANGRYLMVAGHGIKTAAINQKLPTLRADVIPADWSPEQVAGYMIADNQQGYEDDRNALATLLARQRELGYDLAALGHDDATLDEWLREMNSHGEPDFGALLQPQGGGEASEIGFNVTVMAMNPNARDELVSALRGMGYEPEVAVVRKVE